MRQIQYVLGRHLEHDFMRFAVFHADDGPMRLTVHRENQLILPERATCIDGLHCLNQLPALRRLSGI